MAPGRDPDVFEPPIALMTRIWLARLPLFIRVMRAIRCFWSPCPPCLGGEDSWETKPIGRVRRGAQDLSCETKPIPGGRAPVAEGRQGRPCPCGWTEAYQTKPIPHLDRSGRGRTMSSAEPALGPVAQTKPICRHGQRRTRAGEGAGGAVARADRAKQTQFAPERHE